MAFTYSFVDNEIYGTDDINDITKSLTGAGVAPFVSKDSYSVSDLNALTAEMVKSGVSLDGCKCTAENPGAIEMTVTVGQGIVFFDSGVRLTIDVDGYSLAVTPNTRGFVFAYFSPTLQKADIIFDAELPSVGEYVLLAELAADGNINDRREFARSKIATMGKNMKYTLSFEEIQPEFFEKSTSENDIYIVAKAEIIDLSKFNYALVYSPKQSRYELLDLSRVDDAVYLQEMYSYGPLNYAKVVNNRLCVIQDTRAVGGEPYIPQPSSSWLAYYKIILV